MKAWVIGRQGPVRRVLPRLRELPLPRPGRGRVRLRVLACGLCHTDLHIAEGDIPLKRRPIVIGHEIVGVIDALGPGVRRRLGERVGVPWLHSTCGRCPNCRSGRENLCSKARFTGWHVHGGFAEYAVVDQESAYRLPSAYSDAEAAPLMCAGVIGYRALRLSGATEGRRGSRLGLYGFGASAHLTLQLARNLGCRCYVFSRTPEHRALARRLGAVWAGSADQKPPHQLDGGIIFAPAGPLVPKALSHLRRGGSMACAGITMTPIPAFPYELICGERRLVSVANSTHQDVRDMLETASTKKLQVEAELYSFGELREAMRRLSDGKVQGAAVLLSPG